MRSGVHQYRGIFYLRLPRGIRVNFEVSNLSAVGFALHGLAQCEDHKQTRNHNSAHRYIYHPFARGCINRRQCQDVNECLIRNGGCTGECVNTAGSYYCACSEDLVLAHDERTCVSPTSRCRAMEPPLHGEVRITVRTFCISCIYR